MSKFAPRCTVLNADKDDPAPFLEAVKGDLLNLGRIVNAIGTSYLTGVDRIVIPAFGTAALYVVTNTATATSTGVNYHTIVGTRSGQAEGSQSIDTRNAEMAAYTRYYIGSYNVGPGDVLSYTLTANGAPVPTLTSANLSLLCVFTLTDTVS